MGKPFVKGKADFTGISPEVSKRVESHLAERLGLPASRGNPMIEDIKTNFPKDKRALAGVHTDKSTGKKTLYLFPKNGSQQRFEEEWDRSKEQEAKTGSPLYASSHMPRDKMVESIIDHELGHAVYDDLAPARVKEWQQAFRSVPKDAWKKVSEMASRFPEEAFQEAFTLAVNGRKDLIPEQVRDFVLRAAYHGKEPK